jgi:DNA-binding FadR family transcriptional regulator
MEQAWSTIQDLVAPALRDELEDQRGYDRMVRAVQRGEAVAARRAAQHLVDRGEASLLRMLGLAPRPGPSRSSSKQERP